MKKENYAWLIAICALFLLVIPPLAAHLKEPFWLAGVTARIFIDGAVLMFFIWGIVNPDVFIQGRTKWKEELHPDKDSEKRAPWEKITVWFFIFLIFCFLWWELPLAKDVYGLLTHKDVIETKQAKITINSNGLLDFSFLRQDIYINNVDHYQLYGTWELLHVGDTFKFSILKNSGTIVSYDKIY